MKKNIFAILAVLLALASCRNAGEPLDYVDPTIGGVSVLLQPTRPTVQVPNEMIRWSPARRDLLDDQISDFPLTLASHRQQSVFGFLPIAASSALSAPLLPCDRSLEPAGAAPLHQIKYRRKVMYYA